MNLKPTPLKTITSIVVGIIVNFLLTGTVKVQCNVLLPKNGTFTEYSCPQPSWLDFAFDPVPITISIIVVIIVYIIWSLIQKKTHGLCQNL